MAVSNSNNDAVDMKKQSHHNNQTDSSNDGSSGSSSSSILPILALLTAQLFTASWHVLGKHVMSQVPYLAPISYVLIRTLITSVSLLIVGILHEGYQPFPPLYIPKRSYDKEISLEVGLLRPTSMSSSSGPSNNIESGNSIGLSISQSNSMISLNKKDDDDDIERPQLLPTLAPTSTPSTSRRNHRHHHGHHRPRRKKRHNNSTSNGSFKRYVILAIRSMLPSLIQFLKGIQYTMKSRNKTKEGQYKTLNYETIQIISAGLSGMLLLPICYTTGLILTSPTVASVWDGPMIPLGCFIAAVSLGLEQRSKYYPNGQVLALLCTVGGSIVVLLVDYLGGGHGMKHHHIAAVKQGGNATSTDEHVQFIRGNMVLMGLVAAYSATALLQKRLTNHPPIQLTAWMFGIGFMGCLALLSVDSLLSGGKLTGCTLSQALVQLYTALSTSPTFRYGLIYSALFVGGACFSIGSYASSHLESSVITLFAAMQPPITAVLEWIWEGKQLGILKIGGMCCVGVGMYAFTFIKRVEKQHQQQSCKKEKTLKSYKNDAVVKKKVELASNSSKSNGSSGLGSTNLTNRKSTATASTTTKIMHADV